MCTCEHELDLLSSGVPSDGRVGTKLSVQREVVKVALDLRSNERTEVKTKTSRPGWKERGQQ